MHRDTSRHQIRSGRGDDGSAAVARITCTRRAFLPSMPAPGGSTPEEWLGLGRLGNGRWISQRGLALGHCSGTVDSVEGGGGDTRVLAQGCVPGTRHCEGGEALTSGRRHWGPRVGGGRCLRGKGSDGDRGDGGVLGITRRCKRLHHPAAHLTGNPPCFSPTRASVWRGNLSPGAPGPSHHAPQIFQTQVDP